MELFEQVIAGLGLEPRPQQVKLVALAREAVASGEQKFVQAGTGTGKSFAILSVALEAARKNGRPSVVVCPNNTLIDQYVIKDAPKVAEITGGDFVHIKGRSNYVCSHSPALEADRNARYKYAELVKDGQLEWAKLGLTSDYGCPGAEDCNPRDDCRCDRSSGPCTCEPVCGAFKAKQLAAFADVVITNAHVLVWDYLVGVYTGGAAGLLPEYEALFVDECHELEAVGRACMSDEITRKSPVVNMVPRLAEWMDARAKHLLDEGKREAPLVRDRAVIEMALAAGRTREELENDWGDDMPKTVRKQIKRLDRFIEFCTESEHSVSIIEVSDPEKVALRRVRVNASMEFNTILTGQPSVLVSGTIPSSDRRRLGLSRAKIVDVGHPFDYSKSTLIISRYSPKEPRDLHRRIDSAARAIRQTNGGTLMLFTSWQDLELVVPVLAERLPDIDFYAQSREDPTSLPEDVKAFSQDGNAVLAGVRSLFTGLDIPGDALRQVIVWKLPWAVPTTEIQAIQDIFGYQVYRDNMMMTLVQAVGRLIRTTEDRGRILIMDSRANKLKFEFDSMAYHLAEFGSY